MAMLDLSTGSVIAAAALHSAAVGMEMPNSGYVRLESHRDDAAAETGFYITLGGHRRKVIIPKHALLFDHPESIHDRILDEVIDLCWTAEQFKDV